MCQSYDENRDRPETGMKHVKTASFFIKTGFSFVKNSLQIRLRPGCTHHTDPGAGEVQTRVSSETFTGVWECLSAVLEVLLCLVFASFSPMDICAHTNIKNILSITYINSHVKSMIDA